MESQTLQHSPVNISLFKNRQLLTLTIIFHPDIDRIGEQAKTTDNSLEISRLGPLFFQSINQRRPLGDVYVSRQPIFMTKVGQDWQLDATSSTTILSNAKSPDISTLLITKKMIQERFLMTLSGRIVLMFHFTQGAGFTSGANHALLGVSDNIQYVRSLISNVSQLKAPVLIRGETGTGKELIAEAVHQNSSRRQQKMSSVNMASLPREIATSELFGSVKGAFTGATNRAGFFGQADKSSLFLDEIGEASLEVQVALLRSLESGVITPVGSEKEVSLDVRFIAATDCNLEQSIAQDSFKMPLFQRLSGLIIEVKPLRERPEDIAIILVKFLIEELGSTGQLDKLINDQNNCYYWAWFFAQCCNCSWPGNVRQLKNVSLQLSMLLMNVQNLNLFDWNKFIDNQLPKSVSMSCASTQQPQSDDVCKQPNRKPKDISDDEIFSVLESHHWQIKLAADFLHISRASLYLRMDANPNIRRVGHITSNELSCSFEKFAGNIDQMVSALRVSKPALRRRLNEIGLSAEHV